MTHAFDATVVEVYVRDFDFGRQRVCLYGESVIVRSDLDVAITEIFYRLVATAMAEHKLERFAAERPTDQLMTKADAERRHA